MEGTDYLHLQGRAVAAAAGRAYVLASRGRFEHLRDAGFATLGGGITVFDVLPQQGVSQVGAWRTLEAPIRIVAAGDGVLITSAGPKLEIVDLQTEAHPVVASAVPYARIPPAPLPPQGRAPPADAALSDDQLWYVHRRGIRQVQ